MIKLISQSTRSVVTMLLLAGSLPLAAQNLIMSNKQVGDLLYDLYDDGTATVASRRMDTLISSSIVIPKTITEGNDYVVTQIGSDAFSCSEVQTITLPSSIKIIGPKAFSWSELASINLESTAVTDIGASAFDNCTNLTRVQLPSTVTNIGEEAFGGCTELSKINFPASIKEIGASAFSGCFSLKNIDLSSVSIEIVRDRLFSDCSGLVSVQLPADLTKIGEAMFSGCTSLTSIDLPATITAVDDRAFQDCSKLKDINLPATVSYIGRFAFYGCTELTNIDLPTTSTVALWTLNDYAFSACTGLQDMTLPSMVTAVPYGLFWGCTGLKSVDMSSAVKAIRQWAFKDCSGLQTVVCRAEVPPTVTDDAFDGVTCREVTLYVPAASIDDYKNSDYIWKEFQDIRPLSEYADIAAPKPTTEEAVPAEIYTLTGMRVPGDAQTLKSGVYVVRQGKQVRKVVVR